MFLLSQWALFSAENESGFQGIGEMALLAISLSDWFGEYMLLVAHSFRFWSSRGFWLADGDISIRGKLNLNLLDLKLCLYLNNLYFSRCEDRRLRTEFYPQR